MATESVQNSISLEAATSLASYQYCFVKLSAGQAALCGAGQDAIGVLQNDPAAANRAAEIAVGVISKVKIGGMVTQDGNVASDSTGRAVDATSGDYILGKALDGGTVANTIVRVLLQAGHPIM
jgi:hypothetical protein